MRDFQGYGLYMLEEVTYDDKGHVTSAGADRYKIPSVADIPRELNVYLLKDSGNPKAVYSSKVRVTVRVMVPPPHFHDVTHHIKKTNLVKILQDDT